jgi:hypothetical protein
MPYLRIGSKPLTPLGQEAIAQKKLTEKSWRLESIN